MSRRDFGKVAGLAGAGVAAPALLAGCSSGTPEKVRAAGAVAATRTWKVTGKALAGLSGFDATVKSFMQARNVPCGQLAVVRKGKLVLSRGYTWSDQASLAAQPTSLFRVASLSKPVTATAVLRLVQDGKLKLTDRAATLLGLSTTADTRLKDVTVLRLLQHLGGWDRALSPDVMFQDAAIAKALGIPLPVKRANIMAYASGRRLDHAPGTAYAYSNYGYLLLGRIIEKVTGQSYATYVQQKVLAPRGITRMRLGHTLTKAAGEVPYYSGYTGATVFDNSGTKVAYPYGAFNLENMDAHGGWLGTAMDLTRFAGIYDGGTTVLNAASIKQAFAKPATGINADGYYYGCGWQVRPVTGGTNTWHDGSLAGTSTLLVRRYDGLTWAVLFDQRQEGSAPSDGAIDGALHTAANAVKTWPTGDLTSTYF
ncbi:MULTISPECIES: serine hydrolase domain-containing protein [Thermomonosporaceae]|uniref:serine hydrolase domain-containing protein n=1 Tax=Thermomonosporaceae TaxID=2012 RepID=UPI00255AC25F|nr:MULTISPECIES: serine hydrolase domain-containing protein [Thermomonosporaceae]MDL4777580.1 serine hydrolase domain-containing protein [Actinomadura xylanilytica]